jgi:hypothetical protein
VFTKFVLSELSCRYVDAHLPQPSHDDNGWSQVLPLLRLIFPKNEVALFQQYRRV